MFNVLRFHGLAPDHLNVFVETRDGHKVGPFDGYAECGAAYEVDGVEVHTAPDQVEIDMRKNERAERLDLQLVRFMGMDITKRQPMLEAWAVTREAALGADLLGLEVVHQPGGDVRAATSRMSLWIEPKIIRLGASPAVD